jgi:ribosomal protein S12 methylthiotransferase
MDNQIPDEIKQRRQSALAAIQQEVVSKLNKKMIGRKLAVVVENYHPETDLLLVGRYFGQCPEIDGQVILNDWEKVDRFGERYLVEITDVGGYDLIGRVLKPLKSHHKAKSSKLALAC